MREEMAVLPSIEAVIKFSEAGVSPVQMDKLKEFNIEAYQYAIDNHEKLIPAMKLLESEGISASSFEGIISIIKPFDKSPDEKQPDQKTKYFLAGLIDVAAELDKMDPDKDLKKAFEEKWTAKSSNITKALDVMDKYPKEVENLTKDRDADSGHKYACISHEKLIELHGKDENLFNKVMKVKIDENYPLRLSEDVLSLNKERPVAFNILTGNSEMGKSFRQCMVYEGARDEALGVLKQRSNEIERGSLKMVKYASVDKDFSAIKDGVKKFAEETVAKHAVIEKKENTLKHLVTDKHRSEVTEEIKEIKSTKIDSSVISAEPTSSKTTELNQNNERSLTSRSQENEPNESSKISAIISEKKKGKSGSYAQRVKEERSAKAGIGDMSVASI